MPKIIGGSLAAHREQTRARIFAALGDLLESGDFEALTFATIAKAAGVGRTAMYNHFPDKGTLLVEYAMHETTSYVDQLRAGVEGAADAIEEVELYARTQLRLRGAFHMPQIRSGDALAPETVRQMREHVVMIEDVLATILRRGIEGGLFAADLDVRSTVRIVNSMLIGRGVGSDQETDALVAFIVRGLGAQPRS